jgi:sigma-B regulation protein RsbQ
MGLASVLNATVRGPAEAPVVVFVHGFGCGQDMWRHVAPAFEADHRVVLFDLPGAGGADPSTYDVERHRSLAGYRDDVIALLQELGLSRVALVGHSVASMIGVLAAIEHPELVARLVLVAPSARYLDDDGYTGGFSSADIDELLALMELNHLGWQDPLAGMVAGAGHQEAKEELEASFCRTRPEVAAQFAAVTFRGDNRADLGRVTVPTLVLQVRDDVVAPLSAGSYVHEHIPGSQWQVVETTGHSPHLTAPERTTEAIREFLAEA